MDSLSPFKAAIFFVGITGLLCNSAPAQEAESPVDKDASPIEEILVSPEPTLINLRVQIRQAEAVIYDIFNDLNDDEKFDFLCQWRSETGTLIKKQVCEPQFLLDAMADSGKGYLAGINAGGVTGSDGEGIAGGIIGDTSIPVSAVVARYNKELEEKFRQYIQESDELLEAISRHYLLTEELKEKRRAVFSK